MPPIRELLQQPGPLPEDSLRLAQLLELASSKLPSIGREFHDDIMGRQGEHLLYQDTQDTHAFRALLEAWPGELLRGPHDDAYWERRQDIARRYAQLGLPHWQIFTAAARLMDSLTEVAFGAQAHGRLAARDACGILQALNRVMSLEQAVFNITYHRTREARKLRTLQDVIVTNMPVTVLCLDAAGEVMAATRPSVRLFGDQARTGQRFDAFLPPELVEAADLPSHIGRALATRQEVTIQRIQLGHPPQARYLRINIVPLEHPLAHLLLHVEELTDELQAEARAQQAESLARIGALAANVAHEIRNPLAAISLTLQVIARSFEADDHRRGVIDKVEAQVYRLDRLVTDLLDYARPPEARLEVVDLVRVAEDSINLSNSRAQLYDAEPVSVIADPMLLQSALVNLLQNARDAAGEHGLVELRVGPGPCISVVDDGPGISPEILPRLFSPFVTTKARGTGLGLAISRKLIEAQQGTLKLGEQGQRMHGSGPGALFLITLSAARPARTSPADNEVRSG
jgi:signal transduction histidine kinase